MSELKFSGLSDDGKIFPTGFWREILKKWGHKESHCSSQQHEGGGGGGKSYPTSEVSEMINKSS